MGKRFWVRVSYFPFKNHPSLNGAVLAVVIVLVGGIIGGLIGYIAAHI